MMRWGRKYVGVKKNVGDGGMMRWGGKYVGVEEFGEVHGGADYQHY